MVKINMKIVKCMRRKKWRWQSAGELSGRFGHIGRWCFTWDNFFITLSTLLLKSIWVYDLIKMDLSSYIHIRNISGIFVSNLKKLIFSSNQSCDTYSFDPLEGSFMILVFCDTVSYDIKPWANFFAI